MLERISRRLLVLLFLATLTVIVVGPLWEIDGIPVSTGDVQVHLHRSAAVERALRQGVYWPRWFPEVYNDLGAPVFHHYSPGLYWLTAATHLIGLRLDHALKLVVTAALALSGFSVYSWLRHVFSPVASLAATSTYVLQPIFLIRTAYFSGDYPQILALLVLPACLGSLTALYHRHSARNWGLSVISLSVLVVSHNLISMAGLAVLLLYWLLLAIGYRRTDGLVSCASAGIVAALLTAGFWLPAVADLQHVQIENAQRRLSHSSEFFLPWFHILSFQSPILDSGAGNPLKPLYAFGAASWMGMAAGLIGSIYGSKSEIRIWGVAGSLFSIGMLVMASPVSAPLWERYSELNAFQYPFRFLLLAPLGAVPAAASAIELFGKKRNWLPGLILVLAALLTVFPYSFPDHIPMFSSFDQVRALNSTETRSFETRMDAWGTTSHNEFLVRGADLRVIRGEIEEPPASPLTWLSPHEAVVDLSLNEERDPALIRLHFHPGWSADSQTSLSEGPAGWTRLTGMLDHSQPVVLNWTGTVWQEIGERLSLIGLLIAVAGFFFLALTRKTYDKEFRNVPISSARSVTALVGCVLVVVTLHYALDGSSNGPFIRHSLPGQLAFHVEGEPATIGEAGGDQFTLLGWEILNGETPQPGGTLTVRLFWNAQDEIGEVYHTFLHLYTPSLQRSWAVENIGVLRPPTRVWNPEKYYIETMRLKIPADIPPIQYALVAGLVSSSGVRLDVHGSENNSLHLREITVKPLRPGFFQRIQPTTHASADTEDGLTLQGYDLFDGPGGHSLRLFWETNEGVSGDWTTYIHMTDARGGLVAQFDGPPLADLLQTSLWKSKSLYIDSRKIDIPAGLAPGDYLLRIGLYSFGSGERLPFQPERASQEHFENGQLLVLITVSTADN